MKIWHDWVQNIKGYNRNIRLILIVELMFSIGIGMFNIVYNLYIRSAGHPQTVVGNVIAVTSLATAISMIPAGLLSDRFSRKKIIIIGCITTLFTLILRSVFVEESILLTMAFIEGLFVSLIMVSFVPLMSENTTQEQRVPLFSMLAALSMGANVIGNVGGGGLADLLQNVFHYSELISLRITLLAGTAILALAMYPISLIHEEKKERKIKTEKKKRFDLKAYYTQNKSSIKVIVAFGVSSMFIGFGAGLVIPYLNLYFLDRFHASKSAIGIVVSLGQGATAIAMILGPMLVKKLGEVRSILFLQLGSIPFLLLTGFTQSFLLASMGYLFRQALMNAGGPIQQSIMMERVDDSMRGLANSVNGLIFNLGWALMGPVSAGIVQANGSYWGYAYVFMITATLYIIGSVFFFMVLRPKKNPNKTENEVISVIT